MSEAERVIPDAEHEPTDIGAGFIWGALATCLATLLACTFLVLWLYPRSTLDRTLKTPLPLYPEPRLEPDPKADFERLHATQIRLLDGGEPADRERAGSRGYLPITEAMREVARAGIAGWPEASAETPEKAPP